LKLPYFTISGNILQYGKPKKDYQNFPYPFGNFLHLHILRHLPLYRAVSVFCGQPVKNL